MLTVFVDNRALTTPWTSSSFFVVSGDGDGGSGSGWPWVCGKADIKGFSTAGTSDPKPRRIHHSAPIVHSLS